MAASCQCGHADDVATGLPAELGQIILQAFRHLLGPEQRPVGHQAFPSRSLSTSFPLTFSNTSDAPCLTC